jgi:hypothetical protein
MLRPRPHSLNWGRMTTWCNLSIHWKCWPDFARSSAGPGGCREALITHAPCLAPSRKNGPRNVRTTSPSTCHQAGAPWIRGTRLELIVPAAGLRQDNCASRRPALEHATKNATDGRASQRNVEARTEADLILKANFVGFFSATQSSWVIRGCW